MRLDERTLAKRFRVLILGTGDCDHVQAVSSALAGYDVEPVIFDTSRFPQSASISFDPSGEIGFRLGDDCYSMADFRSVYWRNYRGTDPRLTGDAGVDQISRRDSQSLLESLLNAPGPCWFNGYEAWAMHKLKPLQLARVAKLGVPVPRTLLTNEPEEARRFAETCGSLIHKPVFGGSETGKVTPSLLRADRLERVFSASPVTLQQYIEGYNLRTFVIGDDVFSVRIDAETIDFRLDPAHSLSLVDTPYCVKAWATNICRTLAMNWTAIDWRVTSTGDIYFLEANPSPMFVGLSRKTGIDVAARLASVLVNPAASPEGLQD